MLSIGKKLTAEQRLQYNVMMLMNDDRYIALASVLMLGTRTVRDDIPTACTDGRDEMYGREFIDSLTDAELRFVIIHECYHKMYRHLITWKHLSDQNHRLANCACDYVINLQIQDENKDEFCAIPQIGCLIDERFRDMDAAQVFALLQDDQQQQQQQSGTQSGD